MKRYAIIFSDSSQIDAYMPGNYSVIWRGEYQTDTDREFNLRDQFVTVIGGEDSHGWTLDGYVIPRLASGMYFAKEIDLSHPVMKLIPEPNYTPRDADGCVFCGVNTDHTRDQCK